MQSSSRKRVLSAFRSAAAMGSMPSSSPQTGPVGSSRLVLPLSAVIRGAAAAAAATASLPHRPVGAYVQHGGPGLALQAPAAVRRFPVSSYDVFINHRGVDTKKTLAALLYDRLDQMKVRAFLDNRSMMPGDKLFETINAAIDACKVGIAIFSPNYCDSYFCLHELALMVERQKKVIPIFCDVKPSDLLNLEDGQHPAEDLERFRCALREAKYTVGFTFDSRTGNWSDLVSRTSEVVLKSIYEEEEEARCRRTV